MESVIIIIIKDNRTLTSKRTFKKTEHLAILEALVYIFVHYYDHPMAAVRNVAWDQAPHLGKRRKCPRL